MNHLLPFQPKPLRQAVIFMGIQASGKSTFFERVLARHGYVHVNLDTLHTRRNEQMAIQECYQKNLSFVVDNKKNKKNIIANE